MNQNQNKVSICEVKLFAATGHLIKSISRSDLPEELPEIISYAGNYFTQDWVTADYTERSCYVYAEQQVASISVPDNPQLNDPRLPEKEPKA